MEKKKSSFFSFSLGLRSMYIVSVVMEFSRNVCVGFIVRYDEERLLKCR